jgi:hypothetical protein
MLARTLSVTDHVGRTACPWGIAALLIQGSITARLVEPDSATVAVRLVQLPFGLSEAAVRNERVARPEGVDTLIVGGRLHLLIRTRSARRSAHNIKNIIRTPLDYHPARLATAAIIAADGPQGMAGSIANAVLATPPPPDHLFADAQIDQGGMHDMGGGETHAATVHADLSAAAAPAPEPLAVEQHGHGGG